MPGNVKLFFIFGPNFPSSLCSCLGHRSFFSFKYTRFPCLPSFSEKENSFEARWNSGAFAGSFFTRFLFDCYYMYIPGICHFVFPPPFNVPSAVSLSVSQLKAF